MQELLVRGYLYQLLKNKLNVFVAIIMTTLFFIVCHGGVLEAGIIPIANVVTMSIFMIVVMEYT